MQANKYKIHFLVSVFILIDAIWNLHICTFYDLINYSIFIKLTNPLQFLYEPQFWETLRNVMLC